MTFTFYPKPIITDFNPKSGSITGGTQITIVGTNLATGSIPSIVIGSSVWF